MRSYKTVPLIWIVLLLGGCLEHILSDLEPYLDTAGSSGSTSSTSTGEPATPTTSASSEIRTVTGLDETTGAVGETTTGTGPGTSPTPPTVMLSVEPDFLDEAGKPALLSLDASADVIIVRLSMNGGEAVELTPADFPYTYEALSAKDNGMPHVFTVEVEEDYEPLRVDPVIESEQRERLAALRANRDNAAVTAALEALKEAARGTDNVLYPMKEALRLRATGGEVAHALREVWGVYVPTEYF
jgi:hypothetical protein